MFWQRKAAVGAAKVGSGATRYGPALKLADSILSRSPIKRREAVLISDFQRSGWTGSEDVHFPEGYTVTPVSVASALMKLRANRFASIR